MLGLLVGFLAAPGESQAPEGFAATMTLPTNPRSTTQLNLDQAALLATTGEVPVRAADLLGLADPDAVKGRVRSTADAETESIAVPVTHSDAAMAEGLSRTVRRAAHGLHLRG